MLCDGCNVRPLWEHRCFGADQCHCPMCRDEENLEFWNCPHCHARTPTVETRCYGCQRERD